MLPETLDLAIRHHHGGMTEEEDATLPNLVTIADTLINVMDGIPGHNLNAETVPEVIRDRVAPTLKNCADWFPEVKHEINLACEFFQKR